MYLLDVEAFSKNERPSFESWLCFNDRIVTSVWSEFRDAFPERSDEDFCRSYYVCRAIYNNHRSRSARLKKKIEKWNNIGHLYFVTLTFSDAALVRTSYESRRKAVQRFFCDLDVLYCANIDFGGRNGREHYHAVLCTSEVFPGSLVKCQNIMFLRSPLFEFWERNYGYYNLQPVSLNPETCDSCRIAKYISKLTNHALKNTATGFRFLCNRKIPTWAKKKGV